MSAAVVVAILYFILIAGANYFAKPSQRRPRIMMNLFEGSGGQPVGLNENKEARADSDL